MRRVPLVRDMREPRRSRVTVPGRSGGEGVPCMPLPRVAVLDDYQEVALASADWSAITGRADITVFTDHISDSGDLARQLAPYEVIVAMRERTPFPASLLDQL